MDNETPKTKLAVVVIVIIALIVIGYLWSKYKSKTVPIESPTLGQQISNQVQNPGGQVPDVNPYNAKTNPFEKANPLKNIYKNPFEK